MQKAYWQLFNVQVIELPAIAVLVIGMNQNYILVCHRRFGSFLQEGGDKELGTVKLLWKVGLDQYDFKVQVEGEMSELQLIQCKNLNCIPLNVSFFYSYDFVVYV